MAAGLRVQLLHSADQESPQESPTYAPLCLMLASEAANNSLEWWQWPRRVHVVACRGILRIVDDCQAFPLRSASGAIHTKVPPV